MTETVLLVEDELLVALDVQDIIEEAGYVVDGPYILLADALSATASSRPLFAVLDVQLQDGEVFPLADRLHDAGVPVIFHSGHADPRDLRERYPDAVVCMKPSAPSTLRNAISTCCARVRRSEKDESLRIAERPGDPEIIRS